jgi:hypothetical protein
MTTARQKSANRENAKRSTGPKSASGKWRSSSNARRHGLSTSVFADPLLAKEVQELARDIADSCKAAGLEKLAVDAAAAELDIQRIRLARSRLIAQSDSRLAAACVETYRRQLTELCALDRYQTRAMSRRRTALRRFLVARSLVNAHEADKQQKF